MTAFTTLCVNELRRLGCKVSTLPHHDRRTGEYHYLIVLPEGIDKTVVGRRTAVDYGLIRYTRWERQVEVETIRVPWRTDQAVYKSQVLDRARTAADLLSEVARRVKRYDTASSVSRQHFIDTGEYLTIDEVSEAYTFEHHACAECGTTEADTYVVTTVGEGEDAWRNDLTTEVCRACDDFLHGRGESNED